MKTALRVFLLLLAFAFVFPTGTFAADTTADIYKTKCASCHGPDGKGETATGKAMKVKDLASDDVQKMTDADLTGAIAKGKKPMPGYEGKLTNDQISDLVKWIRSLKK